MHATPAAARLPCSESHPALRVWLTLAALTLLLATASLLTWNFLWPRAVEWPPSVSVGQVEEFTSGSVRTFHLSLTGHLREVTFLEGQRYGGFPRAGTIFHVVTYDDGGRVAFNAEYGHPRGCAAGWLPDRQVENVTGVFLDPCLGSAFAKDGTRLFGPVPRDLDRYQLSVENGAVVVRLDRLTLGERRVQPAPSRRSVATPTPVATAPAIR